MFGNSKKELIELEDRLLSVMTVLENRLEDLSDSVDKLEREVWGGASQYRGRFGNVTTRFGHYASEYIGQTKSLSRKIEDVKAVLNEVVDYTYKEK